MYPTTISITKLTAMTVCRTLTQSENIVRDTQLNSMLQSCRLETEKLKWDFVRTILQWYLSSLISFF